MSFANDHLSRWKQRLNDVAWRRTPGRRAWDLIEAKVFRFLIARYERNRLIPFQPDVPARSTLTLPAPQPIWRPRPSRELRSRLDTIQVGNVASYREFVTKRSHWAWMWWS